MGKRLAIGTAAWVIGLVGCSDPVDPVVTLARVHETSNYIYRFEPGDTVDIAWQESYHEWLIGELDVRPTGRLEYFKYRDRAHLAEVTGRETNGFAEPGTPRFHTIWPVDNHEVVHSVVTLHLGHPPALFNEGLAVAHQSNPATGDTMPAWNGEGIHVTARRHDASGALPSVAELTDNVGFSGFPESLTYPSAGSFVRYLLDRDGMSAMHAFLDGSSSDDEAGVTQVRFAETYGQSLAAAWQEWLGWLRAAGVPAAPTTSGQQQPPPHPQSPKPTTI